jgi:hypothetical protein
MPENMFMIMWMIIMQIFAVIFSKLNLSTHLFNVKSRLRYGLGVTVIFLVSICAFSLSMLFSPILNSWLEELQKALG